MGYMQRPLIDDRYEPGGLLGGGGMAEVYLAHDEILARDVALKVLRGQYANDDGFVERFRREAKNAAALNHPNIVQVYDQGSTGDGTYYIAMEYVPGGTLAERIKREGPLDPREAAGIAARVAEALAVAHARGIVHRDIKPQNVLLTASGGAKVADFGIARAASAQTVTETSLILGTASYMSPEQVRGERVGPESDLYSLGVVLYEMLTAEPPYSADNPLATAMKHLEEPPRHPREANPAVPESLDALTVRLLAKSPEDRYASAAELAEDLGRVRDGLPPLAAGLGTQTTERMPRDTGATRVAPVPPAARPRPRRRGLLPLAAVLAGLLLLGGLAWALSSGLSGLDPRATGGAGPVRVPDLTGLSQEEAQGRLQEAGLRLGSRDEEASGETPAGGVVAQTPSAGSEAERGSAVDIVVNTGPAPEATTPPSTSTATSSATSSASATSTAAPSDAGEAQVNAEAAAKEAEKAAKEREKALEEARKAAEERQEERQKAREERRGGT
jgi:eukaryotic-like serine/threonine-protein kinase